MTFLLVHDLHFHITGVSEHDVGVAFSIAGCGPIAAGRDPGQARAPLPPPRATAPRRAGGKPVQRGQPLADPGAKAPGRAPGGPRPREFQLKTTMCLEHWHDHTCLYQILFGSLSVLCLIVAFYPLYRDAVDDWVSFGDGVDTWVSIGCGAGALAFLVLYQWLSWSVASVSWPRDAPYTRATCGPQAESDPVRWTWIADESGQEIPVLEVLEPVADDLAGIRATAVCMGQKIAPFAAGCAWAIWVFDWVLSITVSPELLDRLEKDMDPLLRNELEGYAEGLSGSVSCWSFLAKYTARDVLRLQLLPDLKVIYICVCVCMYICVMLSSDDDTPHQTKARGPATYATNSHGTRVVLSVCFCHHQNLLSRHNRIDTCSKRLLEAIVERKATAPTPVPPHHNPYIMLPPYETPTHILFLISLFYCRIALARWVARRC